MPGYMLLLHSSTAEFEDVSAQDIQDIIAEYMNWRNDLDTKGILTGGQKLADEGGKHLRSNGGEIRVTDGPFAEVKEALGGFFSITADNYDSAVEISKSCPHLKYGGWIELREIDDH